MRIALAGNANTGKTTLFNALCGVGGRTGNYGGVTVERRQAAVLPPARGAAGGPQAPQLIDLPGTLSLTARSPDEAETQAVLLGEAARGIDGVLYVLDATQLARGLYFLLQLQELGLPMLVALHRIDAARGRNIALDLEQLQRRLGLPLVACAAQQGEGIEALREALWQDAAAAQRQVFVPPAALPPLPVALSAAEQAALAPLQAAIVAEQRFAVPSLPALTLWLAGQQPGAQTLHVSPALHRAIIEARHALAPYPATPQLMRRVINARFGQVDTIVAAVETRPVLAASPSQRLDSWLLSPVAGTAALLVALFTLFQVTFASAEPAICAIEWASEQLASVIHRAVPAGLWRSFLVDGLLAGISNIAAFVPQIGMLFFGLGLLEASGYMARAALLLDRMMRMVGLSGRAFVPLMSSFGCAIPGIMATRTMEDRRHALRTMLVAPLISCSARLPVYTLVISAVFSHLPPIGGVIGVGGLVIFSMYVLGVLAAAGSALLLGRLQGARSQPPLILELPDYARPLIGPVARDAAARAWQFVTGGGKTILSLSILLWALLTFPIAEPPASLCGEAAATEAAAATAGSHPTGAGVGPGALAAGRPLAPLPGATGTPAALPPTSCEARVRAYQLEHSAAGRLGHLIEPALQPLGFDWRIGIGLVASFAAREVLVSTLAQIYALSAPSGNEQAVMLRHALANERTANGARRFGVAEGLSLMVFFALALQCLSTVGTLRRETGTWRWPIAAIVYMNALAYVASFITYQSMRLLITRGAQLLGS